MSGILSDNTARSSGLAKAASGGAGVSWVSSIQTSNFTAEAGKGYFVNTTDGAITLTLPASPTAGDIVAIKDYAEAFDNNALTIARNSSPIQGLNRNAKISTARASLFLLYVDSTEGWVYTSQSNVADLEAASFVAATGGTITTSGDFKTHVFNSDGTFEVTSAGNSKGSNSVEFLVVAAGGGGGTNSGGGSGAGGFRTNFPQPATGGLSVSAQEYPITVGGGGTDGPNNDGVGSAGGNSVFSSITSAGGGGGGSPVSPAPEKNGQAGGSGGGGGSQHCGGAGNTPPVSPSQGNNGGAGSTGPNCGSTTGGGGGASAVGDTGQTPGSAPHTNMGACGGAGTANSITGSSVTYAGGGGGVRQYTPGAGIAVPVGGSGGAGGGGNGGAQQAVQGGSPPTQNVASVNGSANLGGGAGGGASNLTGAHGGSGVVIIRYKFQA